MNHKSFGIIGSLLFAITPFLNIFGIITSTIGAILLYLAMNIVYREYREKKLLKYFMLADGLFYISMIILSIGIFMALGLKVFFVLIPSFSLYSLALLVYTYILSGIFYISSAVYFIKTFNSVTALSEIRTFSISAYLIGISGLMLFTVVIGSIGLVLSLIAWILVGISFTQMK
jgi:uncharacterized membrane protein